MVLLVPLPKVTVGAVEGRMTIATCCGSSCRPSVFSEGAMRPSVPDESSGIDSVEIPMHRTPLL